jgi:hypothetical protein
MKDKKRKRRTKERDKGQVRKRDNVRKGRKDRDKCREVGI